MQVDQHKTAMSYTAYVYFSNWMAPYMDCLDTLATRCSSIIIVLLTYSHTHKFIQFYWCFIQYHRYMEAENIPFDHNTAFFINADGQPLYSS